MLTGSVLSAMGDSLTLMVKLGFFRKYCWICGVSAGVACGSISTVSGVSTEVYDARVSKDHYL